MHELEQYLKQVIRTEGPITFSGFMDIVLYHPQWGYYSRQERIGAEGDYYTSVVSHPVFGALLCLQIEQMWQLMDCPDKFSIVEQGAGNGKLAQDIVSFAQHYSPQFAACIHYYAVDRNISEEKIARSVKFNNAKIHAIKTDTISIPAINGCIISNELLDAFPVHRVIKKGNSCREVYVGLENDNLKEITGEFSTGRIKDYIFSNGIELKDGECIEINLSAHKWIENITERLYRGYIITIDYGYTINEWQKFEDKSGTLMCYYQHLCNNNPYIHIGDQDITADVNFSDLTSEGERYGLNTIAVITQKDFLKNLGVDIFLQGLSRKRLKQSEYYCNQFAIRQLLTSEGTGLFKVLIQGKGVPGKGLYCQSYENDLKKRLYDVRDKLHIPLLDVTDIRLLLAKYPHLGIEFENDFIQ